MIPSTSTVGRDDPRWVSAAASALREGKSDKDAMRIADSVVAELAMEPSPSASMPGATPAQYNAFNEFLNSMLGGTMGGVMAGNRTNQALGMDPRGQLDEPLAAQIANLPPTIPTPAQTGQMYDQQVGEVQAAKQQFRQEHPIQSITASLAGGIAGGRMLGAALGPVLTAKDIALGTTTLSNELTTVLGAAPGWATRIAKIAAPAAAGAAQSALDASPGERDKAALVGGAFSLGAAGLLAIGAKVAPFIRQLSGTTTKAGREKINRLLLLSHLRRVNSSVDDAMVKTEALIAMMGQDIPVGSTMGRAGAGFVDAIPIANDDVAAEAYDLAQSLRKQIPGKSAAKSAVTTTQRGATRDQLAWRAQRFNLNKAKQVAKTAMGVSEAEAANLALMADDIITGQKEMVNALERLSKRQPVSTQQLLDMLASAELGPQQTGKISALISSFVPSGTVHKRAMEAIQMLKQEDPRTFWAHLKEFQQMLPYEDLTKSLGRVGGAAGAGTTAGSLMRSSPDADFISR